MANDLRSFLQQERRKLVRYAQSLISETVTLDAEDIVQDIFTKLFEKREDLPPLERLSAYSFRAVRNRVIDKHRTHHPSASIDDEALDDLTLFEALNDERNSPTLDLQSLQDREQLFEALESLSTEEREVIICHELEGESFAALSDRLDIPQNTLLSHKARGLKKLKLHFSKERENHHV